MTGQDKVGSALRVVIFLGPPGVGKGTVASRIAAEEGFQFVSSGDLLRANVGGRTSLGEEARRYMEAGDLVPDDLVTRMVTGHLDTVEGPVILDGFPRTLAQAEELSAYLGNGHDGVLVVDLTAADQFLKDRLAGRLICRGCGRIYHRVNLPPRRDGSCDDCGGELYQREDDRPEVILERLKVYHRQSAPVRDYYRERRLAHTVPGDRPLEETLETVRRLISGDSG